MLVTFFFCVAIKPVNGLMTAGEAARRLSAELGMAVRIDRALSSDIVFIDPHGVDPKVEVRAIGSALEASVTKDGAGLVIRRTNEDSAKIFAARLEERKKAIAARLIAVEKFRSVGLRGGISEAITEGLEARNREVNAEMHGKEGPTVIDFQLGQLMPAEGLLEAVMRRIGSDQLARIPVGEVAVFEDHPKLDAKPLPDYQDLIGRYQTDADELASYKLGNNIATARSPFFGGDLDIIGRPIEAPKRLRLEVRSTTSGLGCTLDIYDAPGRRVDGAGFGVSFGDLAFIRDILISEQKGVKPETIQAPPETLAACAFEAAPRAKDWPAWYLDPEHVEPLKPMAEWLLERMAAQSAGKCFVLCATDGLFAQIPQCIHNGRLYVSLFERRLSGGAALIERTENADSVVWRYTYPEYTEATTAVRSVLGQFARSARSAGGPGFRSIATLLHDGSREMSYLPRLWEMRSLQGYFSWRYDGNMDFESYRLVGAITDQDWQLLASGAALSVEHLGIGKELTELFAQGGHPPHSPEQLPDLYRHAEELFDTGSVGRTQVSMRSASRNMIRLVPGKGAEGEAWAPIGVLSSFGRQRAVGDGRLALSRDQFESNIDRMGRYRLGRASTIDLIIWLPHGCVIELDGPIFHVDTTTDSALSYADVPSGVRDDIWQFSCDAAVAAWKSVVTVSSKDAAVTNRAKTAP